MPGAKQLGTSPMPQSLLKLFKLASPKLLTLPHPFLPRETTIKALAHCSSLFLCLLTHLLLPHVALRHDMACLLLLGTVSNKLSFQWQLSPDLLAFLYLTFSINTLYFIYLSIYLSIYLLAEPRGLWDLSSPTRD